jgi:hypothetical protein
MLTYLWGRKGAVVSTPQLTARPHALVHAHVPVGKEGRRCEHFTAHSLARTPSSMLTYLWGRKGAVVSTSQLTARSHALVHAHVPQLPHQVIDGAARLEFLRIEGVVVSTCMQRHATLEFLWIESPTHPHLLQPLRPGRLVEEHRQRELRRAGSQRARARARTCMQ